tara:strand:- start:519 stop:962 length:444 start_codon:yes stop_codon:yes gene_type:complete
MVTTRPAEDEAPADECAPTLWMLADAPVPAPHTQVVIRMLNTCIKEPHQHLAVFVMQRGGRAHLDFIQNMEYKFVELLSTAFVASDDETVRQNIAFRYNSVKSRLALMQARLQDINALVKIKNPSLLLQLQRTPLRFPTASSRSLAP